MPQVRGKKILVQKFKVNPEECWTTLQQIRTEHGGVAPPQAIVDHARDEASPLHPAFEWNDSKAAEGFRKQQARQLVRAYELVFDDGHVAPAMVSVRIDDRRGYFPTQEAIERPDLKAQVLKNAMGQFLALEARYKTLAELGGIFTVVRERFTELGLLNGDDIAA